MDSFGGRVLHEAKLKLVTLTKGLEAWGRGVPSLPAEFVLERVFPVVGPLCKSPRCSQEKESHL